MGRFVQDVLLWCVWNVSFCIHTSKEVIVRWCGVELGLDGLVGLTPDGLPALRFFVVLELATESEDLGVQASHELRGDGVGTVHACRPVCSIRFTQRHGFMQGAGKEGFWCSNAIRASSSSGKGGFGPWLDQVNGLMTEHHGMHRIPLVSGQGREDPRHGLSIPSSDVVTRPPDGHGAAPDIVYGCVEVVALELALDGKALLVLRPDEGAQAREATRDGDGAVCLGDGHRGGEQAQAPRRSVVELVERGRGHLGSSGRERQFAAVHDGIGPEEGGQQRVLAPAHAAVCKEKDLLQTGNIALVGTAEKSQPFARLA